MGITSFWYLIIVGLASAATLERGSVRGLPEEFVQRLLEERWVDVTGAALFLFIWLPGLILTASLRGGLLFFLFGVGLVDSTGRRATRMRCVARGLATLAPAVAAFGLVSLAGDVLGPTVNFWIILSAGMILAASSLMTIVRPRRALCDVVVRTRLVMK